jgi:riboflavin-specific deaminase-like protein
LASRLYPLPSEDAREIHGDVAFPDSHPEDPSLPYVAINMVMSLDGKVSAGGKSGSIGGAADREAMRVLRSKADAVMIGAGTLRAEKASLTSEGRRNPEPLAVLVSATLDVPIRNLLHADKERTIILTSKAKGIDGSAKQILSGHAKVAGHIDLAEALRSLKESRGVNRILLEGGPTLNHSLVSDGLVSEVFLTISPKILGGTPEESAGIIAGERLDPRVGSELLSIHEVAGEVFLRYSIANAPGYS